MAHLLGAENLRLEFPTKVVLDGVTLGIDEGSRIGVVGRNGDGKSTLMSVLAGRLDNNPANLQTWIRDPQRASPGTAMPDLNVGERDARDISAFLYTRAE